MQLKRADFEHRFVLLLIKNLLSHSLFEFNFIAAINKSLAISCSRDFFILLQCHASLIKLAHVFIPCSCVPC